MNHEERATWIRRAFVLLTALGVVLTAWFYPKHKTPPLPELPPLVALSHPDLEIIHYHVPDSADSRQLAEMLAKIARKYDPQVGVKRIDVVANPVEAMAENAVKTPKVVMMTGTTRACEFYGLWPQAKIDTKVEELLRGIKRVGKNWRPQVQGMTPAGH